MGAGKPAELLRPPRLKVGSTIGLIAPSKSARFIDPAVWRRGKQRLEAKGFTLVEGQSVRGIRGHTGDTIQARVQDLERMFRDPAIDAIMAICGGSNSNQLLDELDYEMLARHPKILIGFSDTTALTIAIYQQTGMVTFSGPSFLTFCQPELPEYTEVHFDQLVTEAARVVRVKPAETWADDRWWQARPGALRDWQSNAGWNILKPGKAAGTSLVGNLETMLLLAGTPYWPDCTDTILFVELCDEEKPATVNRYFTQLRQMGVLNQLTGLVIGRFSSVVPFTDTDTLAMIIDDATKGIKLPVIANVDFGHTDPIATIPNGIACQLDTAKEEIVFTEAAVV